MRNTRAAGAGMAFLLVALWARADDGWIVGIGGSPKAMRQHPTIRMVQETVRIDPWKGTVRAEFVFRNEGKATTVEMGFPESGAKGIGVLKKRGGSGFDRFASYVDGKKAPVRRKVQKTEFEDTYQIYWTKTVPFEEKQTRKVVVEYDSDGGHDTSGGGWFNYELWTGRSWKGRIGSAKIVMDLRGLQKFSNLEFRPKPTFLRNGCAEWHLVNFEPRRSTAAITANWFFGFLDVFVNGKRIAERSEEGEDYWAFGNSDMTEPENGSVPDSFGRAPTREGKDVFAGAKAAAYWLGAEVRFDERTAALTFEKDGRWARVKPGDRRIWTSKGIKMLSKAPFLEEGLTRVPIAAIARGLGGTSSWKGNKLYLKL